MAKHYQKDDHKKQALKDIILKGDMTKEQVEQRLAKQTDYIPYKWFCRFRGKYYDYSADQRSPWQPGETNEQHFASLPSFTEEYIKALNEQGERLFIIHVVESRKDVEELRKMKKAD